ncbi:HD domain-containing protein [Patescibacteria group bacterium]|nr:HD domain-containing protein [Patescibacteria group bacterium]
MVYPTRMHEALSFATAVHEGPKQKRKGKDVPYLTHPLTVALILARAGAREEVVLAGLLHDTIEDCEPAGSVTRADLAQRFQGEVAELVAAVTEEDRDLSWHDRKARALAAIDTYSRDALMVKAADVISNSTELLHDHAADGAATFTRFKAPPDALLSHTLRVIHAIVARWPENPLADDLRSLAPQLARLRAEESGLRQQGAGR